MYFTGQSFIFILYFIEQSLIFILYFIGQSVLHALSRLKQEEILALGLPQFITDLKLQLVKNKLDEIEDELQEKVICHYV